MDSSPLSLSAIHSEDTIDSISLRTSATPKNNLGIHGVDKMEILNPKSQKAFRRDIYRLIMEIRYYCIRKEKKKR